ncbi:MAG: alkaline phosphatase D family protein [Pseudomonadales bacterium]|jgi:alkaline phosphatase D|nr:alkaline phosphatase D family protein [Pseudomonadales bacterium]
MGQLSRRQLLSGLAAGALLPWWTPLGATAARAAQAAFPHGVASGDPTSDGMVLWTRVASPRLEARVKWSIAEDPAFAAIAQRGELLTDVREDHSAKVVVRNLAPGRIWYYRFEWDGNRSIVGRTATLPIGPVDRFTVAVASCSNYPFGHFNAYDAIARDEEIDLVLHLGDYIYEYGTDDWGGDQGAALGRAHRPAHEILSLADYRTRHAQYKSDPGSILMHAAHPLVAIWDDHESANNPWTGGAQNHQPDEGPWSERRAASLQAYYEWMPVRPAEDRKRYWRHFRIGDLASIVSLETRHSGRARQIDPAEHLAADAAPAEVERFRREVLGAPDRPMIDPPQERFLREAFTEARAAGRPWCVLANQIPMARVHVPPMTLPGLDAVRADPDHAAHAQLEGLTLLGERDLPIYLDTWDGYPWARERLYTQLAEIGVEDLLVLTGDSHAFWLNELADAGGRPVGVELGTTGISSPGDFADFGTALGARIDAAIAAHNPEVHWTDAGPRGWLRVTLTSEEAVADFMIVSDTSTRRYESGRLRRVHLRRRDGRLDIEA